MKRRTCAAAAVLVLAAVITACCADNTGAENSELTMNSDTASPVGQLITYGRYEQDGNASNGAEPIEWIILKEEDDRRLVVSKNVIELMAYDDRHMMTAGSITGKQALTPASTSWEGSTVRHWLNTGFFASAFFDGEEKDTIIRSDSGDWLFLLSEEDFALIPEELRAASMTDYCRSLGFTADGWMLDELNSTPDGQYVCIVKDTGEISRNEALACRGRNGVRPAMWIFK